MEKSSNLLGHCRRVCFNSRSLVLYVDTADDSKMLFDPNWMNFHALHISSKMMPDRIAKSSKICCLVCHQFKFSAPPATLSHDDDDYSWLWVSIFATSVVRLKPLPSVAYVHFRDRFKIVVLIKYIQWCDSNILRNNSISNIRTIMVIPCVGYCATNLISVTPFIAAFRRAVATALRFSIGGRGLDLVILRCDERSRIYRKW